MENTLVRIRVACCVGRRQQDTYAGVSKDHIVLGFYRPEQRALTEFAVA